MPDPAPGSDVRHALAEDDHEGGAMSQASNDDRQGGGATGSLQRTTAEVDQLRARVIALETLVISILSGASDQDVDFASDMASYILPRPGSTRHPLTIGAAERMGGLIQRAKHMRLARPT